MLESDGELFVWINQTLHGIDAPIVESILRFADEAGHGLAVLTVAVVVLVLSGSPAMRRARLALLGGSYVLVSALVLLVRWLAPRDGPQVAFRRLIAAGDVRIAFAEFVDGPTLPSVRAATAFMLATLLTTFTRDLGSPWRTRLVGIVGFLVAALCGLAQIYGAVSYPLDVVAGAAIGTLVPIVLRVVFRPWDRLPVPTPTTRGIEEPS